MTPDPNCFLITIGVIGCACGVFWWFTLKERRRYRKTLLDFQSKVEELGNARNQLKELRDTPPVLTDIQLVGHLSALNARILDCILILDDVRINSAEPFSWVAEEAAQSRTISRQERYTGFRDSLEKANIQISLHIDRLLAAFPLVSTLEESLRAGHLDARVGHSDITSIATVLEALDREVSPDDAWRNAIHKIRKEFDPILKVRDQSRELDRRHREEKRLVAAIAFSKYKLPPLTPVDKYRALKARGQRDSFG
jgi:hypothetical protein